jgi:serine/threonine protein kinase/tetratricopeptide (TPR) repeat protein
MEPSRGDTIDRYRVVGTLGRGAMAVVYEALDTRLQRRVALKVVHPDLPEADQHARRLRREALAVAALSHPNVVAVYDAGEAEGRSYIAMELVPGRTLASYIGEPAVRLAQKIGWLADIARALAAAHGRGIIHRDVKPSNVMIRDDGVVKVLDFGIARPIRRPDTEGDAAPSTEQGHVIGTPRYMAPEQLLGGDVDARADQFAWGVLAYELLAGERPWPAGEPGQSTREVILLEVPGALRERVPGLSPALEAVVMRALRKNRELRFASMEELLGEWLSAPETVRDAAPSATTRAEGHRVEKVTLASPSNAAPERRGDVLAERYELRDELGQGGEGVVYRARDLRADADVALKVLRGDRGSEGRLRAFRRELQLARRVTHPNVVRIHDLVDLPGRIGLSMELIDGERLDARIARGPLTGDELARLASDLASALTAAHEAGVVHCDLKPSNILLRRGDGRAVVTDFGVSRARQSDEPPISSASDASTLRQGPLVGTPPYMAPEQLGGSGEVGPAADVYAFGVVMFEAATGECLHRAETLGELRRLRSAAPAPSLADKRSDLPPWLSAAVDRALARKIRDRFASGRELLGALKPADASGTVRATVASNVDPPRPKRPFVGLVAGACAIVMVTLVVAKLIPHATPANRSTLEAAAPQAGPTALTDLPMPSSSSQEALLAYRQGMQAQRDASIFVVEDFRRALRADPSLAAAHLRIALSTVISSPAAARDEFTLARQMRTSLSQHDSILLDAMEPYIQREPADVAEAERRLRDATARFPFDADYAVYLLVVRDGRTPRQEEIAATDRMLAIDPAFGEAYFLRAEYQAYAGDFDGALRTTEDCLRAVPAADRCLFWRAHLEMQNGPANSLEVDAHHLLAMSPKLGHVPLAAALLAEDRPVALAREALEIDWRAEPDSTYWDSQRYALDVLSGDFASAERRALDMMAQIGAEPQRGAHAFAARRLVELYREEGDLARGVAVARAYLERKDAWLPDARAEDFAVARDPTPYMVSVLVHGGGAPAGELGSARDAWLASWRGAVLPAYAPYLWPHAYAAAVESRAEAEEALAARDGFGPTPTYWPMTFLGGDVGRTLVLAGRTDEAIPWLRTAAHSALSLDFPVEHTRSSWWLGQALEQSGDLTGACAAYAHVLQTWGTAKPASVTAAKARARSKAIGCRSG